MDLVAWSSTVEVGLHRPPLLRVNGKAPLDPGWTVGPFEDPGHWRDLLVNHHGNVGIVCGRGVLAIDVDSYKDAGEGSWDARVADCGLDVDTVVALTGRGGRHYFYSYDPALHVPSGPARPTRLSRDRDQSRRRPGRLRTVDPSRHRTGVRLRGRSGPGREGHGTGHHGAARAARRQPGRVVGDVRSLAPLGDDEVAQLDPSDVEAARILVEHFDGHDPARMHDNTIGVWRPDKDDGSASVTVGHIGPGVAKVWTDGWAPFEQNKVYDLGQLKAMAGLGPRIEIPDVPELPDGYRLWQHGDGDVPVPVLDAAARHGLIGAYLDLVEDETEVNVAPVGAMLLVNLGTLIGRAATVHIGEHHHHANLFLLPVGETSTGGKGSADAVVERLITEVEPSFVVRHVLGGFGSGEAVVYEMRDVKDETAVEKRRVITEAEFSAGLRVARREQSILSQIIRQGFDYKPIQHRTKSHGAIIATGHHLAIVGAITPKELAECSTDLDMENGYLNRFLFVHSEIVRVLPFGGRIDGAEVRSIAGHIRNALDKLADRPTAEYLITAGGEIGELWGPWYHKVRFGTGTVPALTRRQHVHVPRMALILAVLDGAGALGADHLRAAMAWSDYSVATVERLFGRSATGKAAQLLEAIREAGRDGLDGTAQRNLFARNLGGSEIEALRHQLEERHLIHTFKKPTGGRPVHISVVGPLR